MRRHQGGIVQLGGNGIRPQEIVGVGFNPLTDSWSLTRDLDVNYMVYGVKGS